MTSAHVVLAAGVVLASVPAFGQRSEDALRSLRSLMADSNLASSLADEGALPVKCGFGLITEATHRHGELLESTQRVLLQLMSRPEMQATIVRGSYRVHFDTSGAHTPAMLDGQRRRIEGTARQYADSVAAVMAFVFPFETTVLGYSAPPADGTLGGGPEYDIYIMELGNLYGYTTPDGSGPEGGISTSCITIDNDFTFVRPDSNKGLPALRVTLAHEFHHAIQIGAYGYWTGDVYFYEMTSTWMEDVAYTGVNDYLNYVTRAWPYSHFNQPDKPFDTNDPTMYSRGIWGHYVARRFAPDVMRKCWEEIRFSRPIRAIDLTLQRYGSSFSGAYNEWMLWNWFTGPRANPGVYYPEGDSYPTIVTVPCSFDPPQTERAIPGSLNNLSGRYHEVLRLSDTLMLLLAHTNLPGWEKGGSLPMDYTYYLSTLSGEAGYTYVGEGISTKLDVPDPVYWQSVALMNGSVVGPAGIQPIEEEAPFPSPFLADGRSIVHIPVPVTARTLGELYIYTSGMDLVTRSTLESSLVGKRQVMMWDGRSPSGVMVHSGIYHFLISFVDPATGQERTHQGKIAVVRK